ncbi:MAG: hypothetical protein HY220_00640 [Candidatus Sungbacteria bacterium]|uniref:DUF5667 domain-containing protein n=1 Tax=Candidatus Sungiibacteriota bacterium TaxID=2750080 RepID=A0A9D6LQK4_9BACT|nr:hypothetical protein [Candidatus Sungbacteria bacterium]
MKSSHIGIGIIFSFLLASPLAVMAEGTTTTTITASSTPYTVMRQNIRAKIEEKKASLTKKFGEAKLQRVEKLAEAMFRKFEASAHQMETLSGKIGRKLSSFGSKGADVTAAKAQLDTANGLIEAAKQKLEDAKNQLTKTLDASNPLASYKNVQTLLNDVRDSLKTARKNLDMVLPLVIRGYKTASTTPAMTASTTASTSRSY